MHQQILIRPGPAIVTASPNKAFGRIGRGVSRPFSEPTTRYPRPCDRYGNAPFDHRNKPPNGMCEVTFCGLTTVEFAKRRAASRPRSQHLIDELLEVPRPHWSSGRGRAVAVVLDERHGALGHPVAAAVGDGRVLRVGTPEQGAGGPVFRTDPRWRGRSRRVRGDRATPLAWPFAWPFMAGPLATGFGSGDSARLPNRASIAPTTHSLTTSAGRPYSDP